MSSPTPGAEFAVSKDLVVQPPGKAASFVIPFSEWSHLRNKIQHIESTGILFPTIASFALGVAGSALVAVLTVPAGLFVFGAPSRFICWSLFVVFASLALMAGFFAKQQRRVLTCTKEDVIAEMDRICSLYAAKDSSQGKEAAQGFEKQASGKE